MIKAGAQGDEGALLERPQTRTIHAINPRIFWMMLALESALLVAVLTWILGYSAPTSTSLVASDDLSLVRDVVWAHLTGVINDPLVEVQPGISVRESNVRGFSLNDTVYYYYVVGNQNFDPLSRGMFSLDQVEVVLRDEAGPLPVVIYTIPE